MRPFLVRCDIWASCMLYDDHFGMYLGILVVMRALWRRFYGEPLHLRLHGSSMATILWGAAVFTSS